MQFRYSFAHALTALVLLSGSADAANKRQSIEEITDESDKIVVGAVVSRHSYWTPDSLIYTDVVVSPDVTIKGDESATVIVLVPGGRIGDTEMNVSDAPEFADGEKVLLFLKRAGDKFDVTGRDAGKRALALPETAAAIEEAFTAVEKQTGRKLQYKRDLTAATRDALITTTTTTTALPTCYSASAVKWPGGAATFKLGATVPPAWATSINAAAATWSNAGAAFKLTNNTLSANELTYIDLVAKYGSTYSNTYAIATVWSNTYTNQIVKASIEISTRFQWSTSAQAYMADVQNILTHEFGHWLRLADIYSPSTCGEVTMWGISPLGETKKRTLDGADINGLISIYGRSASIGAPVLTSPGNGATGVTRTPTLTWTAAAGATSYQVYFGTTASPALVATVTGTSYAPGTLVAGATYYWRVVAKNAIASATSPTYSFTTVSTMAAPVLVSPVNGATVTTLTPALKWNAVSGATSYEIYVGNTTSPPLIGTTTTTTVTMSGLQAGKIYYWKIVARGSSGASTSPTWYFRT